MHRIRKEIKNEFIACLGINPLDYDRKRGVRAPFSIDWYEYDEFDGIVMRIANEVLKVRRKKGGGGGKHGSVLDAFWYLYACYSEKETCEYVMKKNKDGELEPLKEDTVKAYTRRAIKAVKESIQNNEETKKEINNAISRQYYGDDQADEEANDN